MKVAADENIPYLKESLPADCALTLLSGREISKRQLKDQDVLLVRSVTAVNQALLDGTPIGFVGSTTIGTDHIDLGFLQKQQITFAHAPGSNANSVVEYVLSALFTLQQKQRIHLQENTIGIIGFGQVGQRLYAVLQKLSIAVCVYDPFMEEHSSFQKKNISFVSFDTILSCDVVTLHVPLTDQGPFPTYHLLHAENLYQLKKSAVLINTARGAVIDQQALKTLLKKRPDLCLILDVWENEPEIDLALLGMCTFCSPHIAGYSLDGKYKGVQMVIDALKPWAEKYYPSMRWPEKPSLPALPTLHSGFFEAIESPKNIADWMKALQDYYQIEKETATFLNALQHRNHQSVGAVFDAYRRQYPIRREMNTKSTSIF
jgi:erythronate-4-phosphate dehydrogenase